VYLDGIVLKRTWADEVRNVSILVAFGVNKDGVREILGAAEGACDPACVVTPGRQVLVTPSRA